MFEYARGEICAKKDTAVQECAEKENRLGGVAEGARLLCGPAHFSRSHTKGAPPKATAGAGSTHLCVLLQDATRCASPLRPAYLR